MHCVVTAGPTFESLDEVRRLTNHSTGRLGSELASWLFDQGHQVTLCIGQQATWRGTRRTSEIHTFGSTEDLAGKLRKIAERGGVDAVFHAAAVSDFKFGKAWRRNPEGTLSEIRSRKFSTREPGTILVELVPTAKIIGQMRTWFPGAQIIGWKYEVEGRRDDVLSRAREQIAENHSAGCVANGPAYGDGFGFLDGGGNYRHCPGLTELFPVLEQFVRSRKSEAA